MTDITIDPWNVKGKLTNETYVKLTEKFGVQPMTPELITRFEKVTGHKVHPWLRRGFFSAHVRLDEALDHYEAKKPIFLYTGRGPSSEALHLGHIISFMFTKWLQDTLNAIVVIQIADDEKYYFKKDMSFDEIYKLGFENAKDIAAFGFNPKRTFIFSNHDYLLSSPNANNLISEMWKHTRVKDIYNIFGLDETASIGQINWPIQQSAAAFAPYYGNLFKGQDALCLVVYAYDQHPYFRLCSDLAPILGLRKYSSIMCQFLPALTGDEKMSSTKVQNGPIQTIFMNDTLKDLTTKIKKYAFSGGKDTLEEHRRLGGNPDIDISYIYLTYFEEDDEKLIKIRENYLSGKLLSGEIKKMMTECIYKIILEHQTKRANLTETDMKNFYDINYID
jgi:tryptophanyl-tRNA synthetase